MVEGHGCSRISGLWCGAPEASGPWWIIRAPGANRCKCSLLERTRRRLCPGGGPIARPSSAYCLCSACTAQASLLSSFLTATALVRGEDCAPADTGPCLLSTLELYSIALLFMERQLSPGTAELWRQQQSGVPCSRCERPIRGGPSPRCAEPFLLKSIGTRGVTATWRRSASRCP